MSGDAPPAWCPCGAGDPFWGAELAHSMPFLSYKATNRAGLSPHVAYCVNTLLSARLRVQQVLCAAWEYVLEIRDVGARSMWPLMQAVFLP